MVIVSKIRKRVHTWSLLVLFLTQIPVSWLAAQDTASKRPSVTQKLPAFRRQVKDDPNKEMVELKSLGPGIVYDLRYATINNFMHRLMYPENTELTFLRRPVADSLQKVLNELKEKGIGLKIFDAYRPYSITEKMWELIKDDRYVADPKTGSGHNRGISVDLTIIDLQTKEPLNMGTEFDNFSDTAHFDFAALPKEVLQNRLLLKTIMEKNGFNAVETEWWHYNFSDGTSYELLDLSFNDLKKSVKP